MKREIEWVDEVFAAAPREGGPVKPSHMLALVHEVRTEALDSFELELRKRFANYAEGSQTYNDYEQMLLSIRAWRKA